MTWTLRKAERGANTSGPESRFAEYLATVGMGNKMEHKMDRLEFEEAAGYVKKTPCVEKALSSLRNGSIMKLVLVS